MNSYITEQNALYIMNIMKRFMNDKYNFDVSDIPYNTYLQYTTIIMKTIYNRYGNTYSHINLNKVVLSELKDIIIENYINSKNNLIENNINIEQNIKEKYNTESTKENIIIKNKFQDKYQDKIEDKIEENQTNYNNKVSEDDDFLNKLQELEIKRKMNITTYKNSKIKSNITNNIQSFEQVYQTNNNNITSNNNSNISNNSNNSISSNNNFQNIFIPIERQIGKELQIHSWQRNWVLEEPNINGFKWKENFTKQINKTNLKIGCLIGPTKYLSNYGLITIRIEGINEDEENISMISEKIVGDYVIYRPVLDSLSYIRLLSTPWIITLETSDGEIINLGYDSITYSVNNIINNYKTVLFVPNANTLYNIGNSIRIYLENNNTIISASIIDITENTIIVNKVIKENGKLLNFSNQFSIIIETTLNEHFKN